MPESKRDRILIVDDDELVLESLQQVFMDDYEVHLASSGPEALRRVEETGSFAAIVLDVRMSPMDGLETAVKIRETHPNLPIIFYTGYPGDYSENRIEKEHQPFDFVVKNERPVRLIRAVKNAVLYSRLLAGHKNLAKLALDEYGMVGRTPAMLEVFRTIEQIAPTDNKVMILGPTGCGKELVARAIHRRSRRAGQRLAILNCNHKQTELVEAELFGHVRGAFTGAIENRLGMFEYADGGTLLLDEIGDLDITTQAKILRVIETGEMQKIGSPEVKVVDVRLICATHRDLKQMTQESRFREDLYYRLKGVTIYLPPLTERRGDIPELVEHFAANYCAKIGDGPVLFEQGAIDVMIEYDWPGNVRQLLDTVQSLIDLTPSSLISRKDVIEYLELAPAPSVETASLSQQLQEHKRAIILKALTRHGNNVSAAARELQVDPANLHRLIKKLELDLV
jgi:two-component system nitrogen regulation response regulator NtrX